jgi:hypothetical protein
MAHAMLASDMAVFNTVVRLHLKSQTTRFRFNKEENCHEGYLYPFLCFIKGGNLPD